MKGAFLSEKTVKMMIVLTILFLTTGCYSNTPGSHSGIWVEESKSAQAPLNESQNESIVSAVSICTNPTKMVYKVGESINTDGLSLTISYSDGKKERVTSGFICSPQVLNSVGTQKIVAS